MKEVKGGFVVPVNGVIRNLLISALSTCRFTILHHDNPFAEIINSNNLADEDELLRLITRIKEVEDNQNILLSIDDEILIYTALDITCKFYLTNLSDELQRNVHDYIQATDSTFQEVRSTLLKSAEFVRENMRKTFAENDKFMDRVELLDMILTVD
ncbi:MAG: hypothetical protein JNL47_08315 [Bacteroidia bacterium]|nr:hypothetical protein [Bacteroidia bacterium]